MATSLSTVYLAYDINHADVHGSGLLIDPANAELLLHIIEPIQIGYGAVVSFSALMPAIWLLFDMLRSSPSLARFTGASNGQSMEAPTAIDATRTECSPQPLRGLLHSYLLKEL